MAVVFMAEVLGVKAVALLAFVPGMMPSMITGLVTYPLLVGGDFIWVLIDCIVFYWFGSSLERSWGWKGYLIFLLGSTVTSAICWQAGLFLLQQPLHPMSSPWMLISSCVVAWAWLNPGETVLFWFVLPLRAKWIAWITIAILFFDYPLSAIGPHILVPVLGLFALGGVGFTWGYIWYQRKGAWIPYRRSANAPTGSRPMQHPSSGLFGALLRPYRDWQRRRRIAKLKRTFKFDD